MNSRQACTRGTRTNSATHPGHDLYGSDGVLIEDRRAKAPVRPLGLTGG